MKTSSTMTGLAIAATAAALFATVGTSTAFAAEKAQIKCENATACKGHGECKTASNACKGQNSCKGTGWIYTSTDAECKAAQAAAK